VGSSNLDWWSIARNNEVNAYAVDGPSLSMQQHLRVERIGPPLCRSGAYTLAVRQIPPLRRLPTPINEEEWWIDEI
jgi:hypothetical protein